MKKTLIILILTTIALSGCGKKGKLYLPKDEQKNEQTKIK
jgi:predicted small lipoprotein YifL